MVGFQTKLAYGEQKKIFRMIPGLQNAEFLKLGSIHRNLYVNSPKCLSEDLSSRKDRNLFFAGQITGVEGYFDSTCTGLMVAHFLKQRYQDMPFSPPPRESAMGSLLYAITKEEKPNFQPTNINFGLFPRAQLTGKKPDKQLQRERQLENAKTALIQWLNENQLSVPSTRTESL
jgi:methylenetetrahydrofolate--tRNA-(uracil-5-)-methyltransferase